MIALVVATAVFTMAVLALLTAVPGTAAASLGWTLFSFRFMAVNKDIKKRKVQTPLRVATGGRRVKVVFVRHGESVWNSLFNRFGPKWPIRAVQSMLRTMYTFFFTPQDSDIIDTPLSSRGTDQAAALAAYCRSGNSVMPTDPASSIVVSSNLRRAMATALQGLAPRLAATKERVLVDSCLQEGSRNADAHSFMSEPGRLSDAPIGEYTTAAALGARFDPSYNQGNKAPANVHDRIDEFALRLFGEAPRHPGFLLPDGTAATQVVAVGHSLWFKTFFGRFLPQGSGHISAKKKMQNCAAVQFDLVADAATGTVSIDEATVQVLHLGFAK